MPRYPDDDNRYTTHDGASAVIEALALALDGLRTSDQRAILGALGFMNGAYEAERSERVEAQVDADLLRAQLAATRAELAAVRITLDDDRATAFRDSLAVDGDDPWRDAGPLPGMLGDGDTTINEAAPWGARCADQGWGNCASKAVH